MINGEWTQFKKISRPAQNTFDGENGRFEFVNHEGVTVKVYWQSHCNY